MRAALRSVIFGAQPVVTPATILGAKMGAFWNADSASKITITGSGVSSWLDEVAGYDLQQGTDAARPVWSPTSFNGRGGVTLDGVDDYLRTAVFPAGLPVTSATCEMWGIVSQTIAAGTVTTVVLMSYGAASGSTVRQLRRTVASGTNRFNVTAGGVSTSQTATDFTNRHVVRGEFVNGAQTPSVDGVAGSPGAPTLNTGNANLSVGCGSATTPAGFFGGIVHQLIVTNAALTAAEAAALLAYGTARI